MSFLFLFCLFNETARLAGTTAQCVGEVGEWLIACICFRSFQSAFRRTHLQEYIYCFDRLNVVCRFVHAVQILSTSVYEGALFELHQ